MKTPDVDPLPNLLLEQYALGELDVETSAAIDRRMRSEPELAARLEALLRSNQEILAAHPPGAFAEIVRARAERTRAPEAAPLARRSSWRTRRLWWIGGPALAAVAAILFFVIQPSVRLDRFGSSGNDVRIKGEQPHINIYRKNGTEVDRLRDGSSARPGDLLQISYVAAGAVFGVVLSVDGAGVVTVHRPESGGSTRLEPDGEHAIPHAYRLDDAPSYERFFFVYSPVPIRLGEVEEAARRLVRSSKDPRRTPLPLPDGLEQYSITLDKEPRS